MTLGLLCKIVLGTPMVILVIAGIYQMIKSMNLGEGSPKSDKKTAPKSNKLPSGKVDKFN